MATAQRKASAKQASSTEAPSGTMIPLEDYPDEPAGVNAPASVTEIELPAGVTYTLQELVDAGFKPEDIAIIRREGLVDDVPLRPVSELADVQGIGRIIVAIKREIEDVKATAKRRESRLQQRLRLLEYRYADRMAQIVEAQLPKRADGTVLEQYVDLETVRAGFRHTPSRWQVTDEQALIEHLQSLAMQDDLPDDLADAVRSQTTLEGREALADLLVNDRAVGSVMVSIIQGYLARVGTEEVVPETGEIRRQAEPLPGVRWKEGERRFYIDPPAPPQKPEKSKTTTG